MAKGDEEKRRGGGPQGGQGNQANRESLDILKQIRAEQEMQNSSLSDNLSSQTDITQQLVNQKQIHKENTQEIGVSVNLSRRVTKSIQDSVSAGKDLNSIESALIKNKTLENQIIQQIKATTDVKGLSDKEILNNAIELVALRNKEKELTDSVLEQQNLASDLTDQKLQLETELQTLGDKRRDLSKELAEAADEDKIYIEEKLKNLDQQILKEKEKRDLTQDELDKTKQGIADDKELLSGISSQVQEKQKILPIEEKHIMLLSESIINLDAANAKLQEQKELQESINKAMGLGGDGIAAINKLFGGQLGSVREIEKASRERIQNLMEERAQIDENGNAILGNVSKLEGFAIQISEIGKALRANIFDPLVLIAAAFDFSKQSKELRDNLAISEQQANDLVQEFGLMATASGDVAINGKKIQEAMLAVNKSLGFGGQATKEFAVDTAVLMDRWGMGAEAAGNFTQSAMSTGKSVKALKMESIAGVRAIENQVGRTVNLKAAIMDAAEVTGEMRANFGGSVAEITKGIAMARAFGMELDDLASASKSLLDFESSIEAELEAELLTGKQLNLERARAAALTGDMKTLTEELNKNMGSYSDFLSMNVLQREAQAKAMGMTVGQLEEILMKDQNLAKLAQEARARGDEDLAKQLERKDAQQRFNDLVDNLKQKFIEIAGGPIGQLVESMVTGIEQIVESGFFKLMFGLVGNIAKITTWILKIPGVAPLIIGIWAVSKMTGWFNMAQKGWSTFKNGVKGAIDGVKNLMGKTKDLSKGASNIKFDPRMAGGGRFKDVTTGKMVSNKAAAAAGAKKTDLFPGVKPKDISKDATAATKDGGKVAKGSMGIKKGLKDLAAGLKAMGDTKVFKGIAAIALAGPAFLIAVPAIPFLSFMGLVPLKMLKPNMQGLAAGLRSMGKNTFKGIGALAALGAAGALALLAIPFLGFIAIAGIPVRVGLTMLGKGLSALGGAASNPKVWLAVALLGALGVALIPFGIALAFAGAGAMMFGKGIQAALTPIPPIINAIADAIVKVLGAFGDFVMQIAELPMEKLLLMGPALALLGAGIMALGVGMLFAAPGLLLLQYIGIPALTALGELSGPLTSLMETLASGFERVTEASGKFFTTLSEVDWTKMLLAFPALTGLGLGLLSLGVSAIMATPGLLILKWIMPTFKKFGGIAENLETAASAIERLAPQIDNMRAIGSGFKSMAGGLAMLAGSLLLITPMLPTLAALSAFGLIGEGGLELFGGGKKEKEGKGEGATEVSLNESSIKAIASAVGEAVSNIQVNTEVTNDIWGSGNRNAKGTYQSKVKNDTVFA